MGKKGGYTEGWKETGTERDMEPYTQIREEANRQTGERSTHVQISKDTKIEGKMEESTKEMEIMKETVNEKIVNTGVGGNGQNKLSGLGTKKKKNLTKPLSALFEKQSTSPGMDTTMTCFVKSADVTSKFLWLEPESEWDKPCYT